MYLGGGKCLIKSFVHVLIKSFGFVIVELQEFFLVFGVIYSHQVFSPNNYNDFSLIIIMPFDA